jgi:N-acetylglutamate synthase-like GNAT family acetyltransferase
MEISVRPASQNDSSAITAMVRQARLNPANLDWRRFVVAERDRTIVGVAQVRRYADGARELASLVVQASFRGQGVATTLIDVLLRDDPGEMFALIDRRFAHHFERWGFHVIRPGELPRPLFRVYLTGLVVTSLVSVLSLRRAWIVPLKRSANSP